MHQPKGRTPDYSTAHDLRQTFSLVTSNRGEPSVDLKIVTLRLYWVQIANFKS